MLKKAHFFLGACPALSSFEKAVAGAGRVWRWSKPGRKACLPRVEELRGKGGVASIVRGGYELHLLVL